MPVEELARIEALPRDWPARDRLRIALWLNAAAPGAGLIALQRPRPGLILAVGFFLSAQAALLGILVMPLSLGRVAMAASCLAAFFWIAAQVLLLHRASHLEDSHVRLYVSCQIEKARQAIADAQWTQAADVLRQSADYDDEQPDLNWLLARVQTAVGPHKQARRQWRRLDQVDRRGRYEEEIRQALSAPEKDAATPLG